ncbi:MAG: cell division protein FtsA, partial [Lachnospiraceae bacterium]|nr:cell division protein FtsA [Lachnospiraceae bacterium]
IGAGFSNDDLFPKRGKALVFDFNGKQRTVRGALGESCRISVNGKPADITSPIRSNDVIVVEPSTAGEPASMNLSRLPEIKETIRVSVNGEKYVLPKYASVNGVLETPGYEIKSGDDVQLLPYYTVEQIIRVMDVVLDDTMEIRINHEVSGLSGKVYDNFTLEWGLKEPDADAGAYENYDDDGDEDEADEGYGYDERRSETSQNTTSDTPVNTAGNTAKTPADSKGSEEEAKPAAPPAARTIDVTINGRIYTLKGKPKYVYVDAFDYIEFDLSTPRGKTVETLLNGRRAAYMEELNQGDVLSIMWKD